MKQKHTMGWMIRFAGILLLFQSLSFSWTQGEPGRYLEGSLGYAVQCTPSIQSFCTSATAGGGTAPSNCCPCGFCSTSSTQGSSTSNTPSVSENQTTAANVSTKGNNPPSTSGGVSTPPSTTNSPGTETTTKNPMALPPTTFFLFQGTENTNTGSTASSGNPLEVAPQSTSQTPSPSSAQTNQGEVTAQAWTADGQTQTRPWACPVCIPQSDGTFQCQQCTE